MSGQRPPNAADRRRQAAVSGHEGDGPTARSLVDDPDDGVRSAALGALDRLGELTGADLEKALADSAPGVRHRALAISPKFPGIPIDRLLDDPNFAIAEVAAWACGERHADRTIVVALANMATEHENPLCREAAVASLGALGHEDGRAAILEGLDDIATVRRRAVLALAPFEGDEIDAALKHALTDRDWQVRQAAEDLLPPE